MANVDVAVKISLKYNDGSAAKSVGVKAVRQSDPLLSGTMATSDVISATSNSSTGVVSLTLKGTDAVPVSYKITLSDGQYFYLNLPKSAKSCNLGIVTVSAGPSQTRKNITGMLVPRFLGADIAITGADNAIAPTCSVHTVTPTSTTSVASITAQDYPIGQLLTLIATGAVTFKDGSNLKLAGNFVAGAGDALVLVSDGTDFYEVSRSDN